MTEPTPFPLLDRFWAKTRRDDNGCLIWTGALNSKGYGLQSIAGRLYLAHRLSCAAAHGPIPKGYDVDHLCRVRECVEPTHLEAVTRSENNRRMREALGITQSPPKPRQRRPRPRRAPKQRPELPHYNLVTHSENLGVWGVWTVKHPDIPERVAQCRHCQRAERAA